MAFRPWSARTAVCVDQHAGIEFRTVDDTCVSIKQSFAELLEGGLHRPAVDFNHTPVKCLEVDTAENTLKDANAAKTR